MELTVAIKRLLQDAVDKLKGPARRTFMAQTVQELGRGGQRVPHANRAGTAPRSARVARA